jgi:hypothetical protein
MSGYLRDTIWKNKYMDLREEDKDTENLCETCNDL